MTHSPWSRRDFLTRGSLLGSAAVAAPTLLAACASSNASGTSSSVLAQARKQGYISIGVAGEIPAGFVDKKTGQVTGQAPTVAGAIFKNLGVPKLRATTVDFGALIPGLNAGHFDMVCAGMAILPARCQHVAFSVPDHQGLVSFLVPAGNPKGIMNFTDVKTKGVPIATEVGAVEVGYAKKSGVPASQIKEYTSPDELLSAVTTGRVYAGVLTNITFTALAKQNPSAHVEVTPGYKPIINGKPQAEVSGFAVRKDETDLLSKFNAGLKQLQSSGEWLKLSQPFGFVEANLPPADVTTQELCSGT